MEVVQGQDSIATQHRCRTLSELLLLLLAEARYASSTGRIALRMEALPLRRHAIRASLLPRVHRPVEQPTLTRGSYEQSQPSTTEEGLSLVAGAIENESIDTTTHPSTNQEPHMSEPFQGARLQFRAFRPDRVLDTTGAEANLELIRHSRNRLAEQRHSLSRRCDMRRPKEIEHLDPLPSPRRTHFQTSHAAALAVSRALHLFDTFQGMPQTDPTRDLHRQGDFANTSLSERPGLPLGPSRRPVLPWVVSGHRRAGRG